MTADRAPAGLARLGNELVARMTGGLVCSLEHADYTTRLEIARRSAVKRGLVCPENVLVLIAQELTGDGRQIAGALNRLEAASEALGQPITLEFAQAQLVELFQAACHLVRMPDIERAICDVYGLEPNSLQHAGKSKELNEPRMLAMWLARKYTRAAFTEIGQYFGQRSHSTVIAAQKRVVTMLEKRTSTRIAQSTTTVEDVVRRLEHRLRTGS
jgi:chromosomal replication initiator protein